MTFELFWGLWFVVGFTFTFGVAAIEQWIVTPNTNKILESLREAQLPVYPLWQYGALVILGTLLGPLAIVCFFWPKGKV